MTTTRRHLFGGAAALALTAAAREALGASPAPAETTPAETVPATAAPIPVPAQREPEVVIATLARDERGIFDQLDDLYLLGDHVCAEAWADYKQRLDDVIDLDPDRLAAVGFGHPVALMDEAAIGLYVTGWDAGVLLGFMVGRAQGPVTALSRQQICTTCRGHGLLWGEDGSRARGETTEDASACPDCAASGVVLIPDAASYPTSWGADPVVARVRQRAATILPLHRDVFAGMLRDTNPDVRQIAALVLTITDEDLSRVEALLDAS